MCDDQDDDGDDRFDAEDCWHEDYDSDILSGRATCNFCRHAWWQTSEEIAVEIERIRRYYEWVEEQERPWFRFKEWARGWWQRLTPRTRRRRSDIVDDIPF